MHQSILLKKQFIKQHLITRFDVIPKISMGMPIPTLINDLDIMIENHLRAATDSLLGTYLIDKSSMTKIGVVDLDGGKKHRYPLKDPIDAAKKIQLIAQKKGVHLNAEFSRSGVGLHLWFIADEQLPAKVVRDFLFEITTGGYQLENGSFANPRQNKGIEVFPKQDQILDGGYGNLVFLPWGNNSNSLSNKFFDLNKNIELGPEELVITKSSYLQSYLDKYKPIVSKTFFKENFNEIELQKKLSLVRSNCLVFDQLLRETTQPINLLKGMSNRSRYRLAQILKHLGLTSEEILNYFENQPNFRKSVSLLNIKSINMQLPPPNCKQIAMDFGLCNGRCNNLKKCGGGSPIAFLNKNSQKKGV